MYKIHCVLSQIIRGVATIVSLQLQLYTLESYAFLVGNEPCFLCRIMLLVSTTFFSRPTNGKKTQLFQGYDDYVMFVNILLHTSVNANSKIR